MTCLIEQALEALCLRSAPGYQPAMGRILPGLQLELLLCLLHGTKWQRLMIWHLPRPIPYAQGSTAPSNFPGLSNSPLPAKELQGPAPCDSRLSQYIAQQQGPSPPQLQDPEVGLPPHS